MKKPPTTLKGAPQELEHLVRQRAFEPYRECGEKMATTSTIGFALKMNSRGKRFTPLLPLNADHLSLPHINVLDSI